MTRKASTLLLAAAALVAVLTPGAARPSSARGAVASAHSGWEWAAPAPQGETLSAIAFAGARGYAAGRLGTLLRTDDSGSSWTALATGVTRDLTRVATIGPDSVVVAGGCTVRRSDDAGATFARLGWTASDSSCQAHVAGLAFPSGARGYLALGDGSVVRTDDGGVSWSQTSPLPGTRAAGGSALATGIAFRAADAGVAVTSAGAVYRTADGGVTWTLVATAGNVLRDVSFVTGTVAYAVGDGTTILRTGNGGTSWTVRSGGGTLDLRSVRCADTVDCIATTGAGDLLLRTDDGWHTSGPVSPGAGNLLAVAFASPLRALAVGELGTTAVTDDSGVTWSRLGRPPAAELTRLRSASPALAFATGPNGTIARSEDGGVSWQVLAAPTSEDLVDVSFADREHGFALDITGTVMSTGNAGASWRVLHTGATHPPQAILASGPGTLLLVGPQGVRRSRDGGRTFARSRSHAVHFRLTDADRGGRSLFVYGSKNIAVSTNEGRSWRKVHRPHKSLLAAIDFTTARTGYALGQDGRLWKTRNRGRTWSNLAGIGTDQAAGLSFSGPASGYLVLPKFGDDTAGYLLRTTDGGHTWRPQLLSSAPLEGDGIAATRRADLALTAGGGLLFTSSGGDRGAPSRIVLSTPHRRVRRGRRIRVSGRVSGAAPGSKAVVARRKIGERGWDRDIVTIPPSGRFTTTWRIGRASAFVAQWAGDADQAGDGSHALVVRLAARRPPHR